MFNPDHLPVYPSVSITMLTYVAYMHKRTERMNELIFAIKKKFIVSLILFELVWN